MHRLCGKRTPVHKNVLKKENLPETGQGGPAPADFERKNDSLSKTALDRAEAVLIVSLRRKKQASVRNDILFKKS